MMLKDPIHESQVASSAAMDMIAVLMEQNKKLHTQIIMNVTGESEIARRRKTEVYNLTFREFEDKLPKNIRSSPEAPLEGMSVLESDALVVGWCDDPIQSFAQEVAPYIMPWKPLKLVFAPHLGRQLSSRGVHDVRFTSKAMPESKFPHILFCQGWNYKPELKEKVKFSKKRDPPPGYPVNKWVDGVWWPNDAVFRTHRKAVRPFVISANMEAKAGGRCNSYDVILDTKTKLHHSGCPTIWTSMGVVGLSDHIIRGPNHLLRTPDFDAKKILESKRGFCAFLYRFCDRKFYGRFATMRVAFHDILKSVYKAPDALGGCRRRSGSKPSWFQVTPYAKHSYMDEAVEWFGSYKFVITFENSRVPGYTTEKILNAMLANTIPIYLGDPNIEDYINPRRFIHCKIDIKTLQVFERMPFKTQHLQIQWLSRNMTGLRECAERVRQVDEDDKLYMQMLSEPILHGNTLEDSPFDYAYYG
eukprot:CAMPEP_0167766158 /NCGR_PEP_ID=MMETSP0110_2-20121227/15157_1 /TAXON_ID=629695 /ORGANISM="Gymnochlora sp., Strain CCMP2014" /LENGTH=472 /DNA_ID=CAMNT_0007654091 /DNA_START=72 /DNA_END=1486 /DNA_ORIENTATION=-